MTTPRRTKRKPAVVPSKRIDVTRLEYEWLRDQGERNKENIRRVEMTLEIQFKRFVELQNEIDMLKRERKT
jgi:hypothetical protein